MIYESRLDCQQECDMMKRLRGGAWVPVLIEDFVPTHERYPRPHWQTQKVGNTPREDAATRRTMFQNK